MSSTAAKTSFRKRFLKTGLTVLCSAFIGGSFAAQALKRKAESNSLALNLMSLPASHREILTTFENLQDSQLTPSTYVSSAESLLPHVRKLKANITTHHVLRIEAALFLKKYHIALADTLNNKLEAMDLDLEEYLLHQRRRISDMKLAFDFVNFKASQVSENITKLVSINKIDYARMARDAKRLRIAFDEIYNKQQKGEETEKETETETEKENLLEHELMALYTHSPYLGEWETFMKIGNALYDNYGRLELEDGINGHRDGINFTDLYSIGKQFDIVTEIPTPMQSNLKFDVKPIEYIKVRDTSSFMSKWIELNNDNYNDADNNILPLGIYRLGGVQKTVSISKCVPRVQGPIFYDHKIKMRGSVTFMTPIKIKTNSNKNNKTVNIIPNDVPLNGINDFIQIRQIEEWDLQPIEVGNTNEFKGKVTIRRQPVDANYDQICDTVDIEYDCILKLAEKAEDYY